MSAAARREVGLRLYAFAVATFGRRRRELTEDQAQHWDRFSEIAEALIEETEPPARPAKETDATQTATEPAAFDVCRGEG